MSMLAANALPALVSAVLWGGADFAGGMGVKNTDGSVAGGLRVVMLSHASSLVVLVCAALVLGDAFPQGAALWWGLAAGVMGGLSLTAFYIALSRGAMGVSAAVSGLLAAAIPAGVAMVLEGSPGMLHLTGFAVAGAAIWLIAAAPVHADVKVSGATMALAIFSGAGFGVYFVCLKYAGVAGVVWPMATARMGSLTTCALLMGVLALRGQAGAKFTQMAALWALGTACLDTSGNLLFIAATRAGRLDIAAVLAALYPASTILLAAWTLKEHPTRRQAVGMGIAAVAVAMISL